MDSCVHQKRNAKVKEWIETLRTACPYRMNDKANDKRRPIGRLIGSKVNILEKVDWRCYQSWNWWATLGLSVKINLSSFLFPLGYGCVVSSSTGRVKTRKNSN